MSAWKNATLLGLVSVAILLTVACGLVPGARPAPTERVTLRLNFRFAGQDMAWILGVEKGFYAEEGLIVELLEGTGSATTVQLIAANSDTFGFVDLPTMASGVAEGMSLVSVSAINQKSPNAIIARKDSNVTKPADLRGKKIAMSPGTAIGALFPAFAKANALDLSTITVVSIGSDARNQAILNKQVDAVGAFGHSSGVALKSQGLDVNVLFYSDHGIASYGQGIIVHTDTLKNKPDMVRRFVRASKKTWQYANDHVEEAYQTALKVVPTIRPSARDELIEVLKLNESEDTRRNGIGSQTKEQWQQMETLLVEYGMMKKKASDVSFYFTNDYLR